MQLAGSVAVITGGASGLGAATARLFAGAGAKLALWDLNAEAGNALAAELGSNGSVDTRIVAQGRRHSVYAQLDGPSGLAMNHGDGTAPIARAGDQPVAQPVMDSSRACAGLLQPSCHL